MKATKKHNPLAFGGEQFKTRYGRSRPRPLCSHHTMHLVLRSTRAVGAKSFRRPRHFQRIEVFIRKFSHRFGVEILDHANNHNHLHLHIQLRRTQSYTPFIRALTAAIAIAVDGHRRKVKFWDLRPYTRIALGKAARAILGKYILINRMEALGCQRETARNMLALGGVHYAYG